MTRIARRMGITTWQSKLVSRIKIWVKFECIHATFHYLVLGTYGVTKSNIGFILDATYTWIISLILLICMCYRPQRGEPRSRQEADELFGTRATEESRIFKATFTVLLFFFNLLHWGMFVSFSQVRIKNMFFLAMPTKPQCWKLQKKVSFHFKYNQYIESNETILVVSNTVY